MFEWDEQKSDLNFTKHGLDFNLAIEVFSDPRAMMQFNRCKDKEDRYHVIGSLQGELIIVLVVFTLRKEKIRIISARKANKKERAIYG